MKTKLILIVLLCSFTGMARAADNTVAGPKYNSGNENQVPYRTTDDGSGHQIPHTIVDSGSITNLVTATTVVSTALEASHVLKNSSGALVSLHVFNSKTSAQYILIMDSATVPANGAVTLLYPPIYIPATSNVSLTFPIPLTASTGISVSNSSTGSFTKTIGSADCVFMGQVQ